ncbi:MAG: alpha/beta hydrolase [Micrococcales bacterium]|nr:alpha/beta hydrolase [Micrococcales bacterium]
MTPRLAARTAARRWHKLPGNKGRRQDNRAQSGQVETLDTGLPERLVVESWGSGDRLVYLVHGWGGWRGQVAAFVQPLVEAGFRVIAADTAAHGDSEPGRYGSDHSSGGEMIEGIENVIHHFGQPHAVIAHSLGCANICRAILDGEVRAERLVLVAPNPDMEFQANKYGRSLGFRSSTIKRMIDYMELWAKWKMSDFDVATMAQTGRLPPALIIHDRADKETPYDTAEQMAAAWPTARLMTTSGLGHHRILISKPVIEAATRFVVTGEYAQAQ